MPKPKPVATPIANNPNMHVVGCMDPTSSQEVKRVVYAKVRVGTTYIRFLCTNCRRTHNWPIDPKHREKVN